MLAITHTVKTDNLAALKIGEFACKVILAPLILANPNCSSNTDAMWWPVGGSEQGPRNPALDGAAHVGATWRIRSNDTCAEVMGPCVKLSRPLVLVPHSM